MTAVLRMEVEMSSAERRQREDLAACFRLAAHFGWDDLIFTHFTARVPGTENEFLINPRELTFEEIGASDLVKVDVEGQMIGDNGYTVPPAGFVIHSAIHLAREDAHCVMHLHSRDGAAVSTTEQGLLPLTQTAMLIAGDIAFHEFEGVALRMDERERLRDSLGDKRLMFLRNHGTLAVGSTPAEAFFRMYLMEWSASVQIRALSTGMKLHEADPEVVAQTGRLVQQHGSSDLTNNTLWPAMIRMLDRRGADFRR